LPDVFGFGVMISTPSLMMSGQSSMPFGLPLRTTKTIVDVYGSERFGRRLSQSFAMRPALAMAFVSDHSASVATSASSPSMMARACVPEPPCDWRIETPGFLAVNAALIAR
jgi:hypothetical protein